ncbi:EAL domain-containing protein [Pseudanabaena sp. FACHB-2040]|uniref:putative bifunctional diguanylate cyclase/phosphodiesterase n=1 Tax=Pseudanabaena sp. FACHB-2040 TaxID=2692859 RepID=UPI001A7E2C04|nr:EAL domain-containing protein [Pseudanabaena sp. FACHB-2040]
MTAFKARAKALVERLPWSATMGARSVLVATLITTTLVTGAKKFGLLQPFELNSFDTLTRLQPDRGTDPRLLIIAVSEAELQAYGWPLSDGVIAATLQAVQQHQPRVIGLDLYRSTPQPPGNAELVQQLEADNLIGIWNVGNNPAGDEVPGPPAVPAERLGFNDLALDPDGVLRRSLLFVGSSDQAYYSFGLRVAQRYLGQDVALRFDEEALYLSSLTLPRLQEWSGGYQAVDNGGYQILTRYRSREMPAQQLTVAQVLKGQYDPAWIRDRVVLIGSTAASLKDEFYTPYTATQQQELTQSGVVVHAQIISQLLEGLAGEQALYRFLPAWGEFLWLVGWTLAAGVVASNLRRPLVLLLGVGFVVALLWGIGWVSLFSSLWVPVFEPLVGLLVAGGLVLMQQGLYRSTHDWVTDLPGRELFLEQVRRALQLEGSERVMVAFLDINRFKLINQSLGYSIGDRVLLMMAKRLRQTLPEDTLLARVGGDEFALLFQQRPQAEVEGSLKNLQKALAAPFCLNQQRLAITASLGLAITQGGTDYKAEDLLRDAHTAMYRAKALDQFSYEVFSRSMQEAAAQRLQLESHLLEALEKQEFVLYYQPIVALETGRITGFEALVRWRHPDQGFVAPNAFIPIAEETGLILELGQWIFREACQQLERWQRQVPRSALKMSINLSRRQFVQSDLVQQIAASLRDSGVSGQQIQLEITESMIMRDVETSRELMLRLKELGLQLAIDDFGTGYSSLSYLHRFPTDTLKIDRSFVSRMEHSQEDREIVHTIITLGHKLNLTLVAEGIETVEQMVLLRQMGCQFGQGFLFSKPVTGEDAIALLTQPPSWLNGSLSGSA